METLPESYDERVRLLYGTLEVALGRLLTAARKKDVLSYCPPEAEGDAEDVSEPQFTYDYGFNALSFLSDVLRQAHPESVVARKLERLDLFRELQRRALFARQQCSDADVLRRDAQLAAAGIASPPLTAPVSSSSILVVVRPRCTGYLVVHVSSSADFTAELQTLKEPVTDVQTSCKVGVGELHPSRQYFVRCCVEDESIEAAAAATEKAGDLDLDTDTNAPVEPPDGAEDGESHLVCFLQGPRGGVFAETCCWTLPAEQTEDAFIADDATAGSRPNSAMSDSRTVPSEHMPAFPPMFSLFLAGAMDKALAKRFTKTRSGARKAWPSLELGAGFDCRNAIFIPPASEHLNADAWPPVVKQTLPSAEKTRPVYSCLLGDVFPPSGTHTDLYLAHDSEGRPDDKSNALYKLLKSTKPFTDPHSILCNSSIFLAWNDSAVDADVALKAEEAIYKQWAHDKRKLEKKMAAEKKGKGSSAINKKTAPPVPPLQRPPITPSLSALVENFPVLSEDEETRKLYKSVLIGQHVELLLLDTRRGYLGRCQVKWLKSRLTSSTATWKIVLSGSSFGRIDVKDEGNAIEVVDNQNSVSDCSPRDPCNQPTAEDGKDDATPATKRLGKSVSITRLDDLDEHGRFKDSIQALLFSLQKDALDESATLEQPSVASHTEKSLSAVPSVAESIASAATRGQVEAEHRAALDTRPWPQRFDEIMQQHEPGPHTFAVTSGIVLLTGNGSRTIETAVEPSQTGVEVSAVPKSSALTMESCFVALYNPKDVGNLPFCAEVNVCGHETAPGLKASLDESMGAYCAFPTEDTTLTGGDSSAASKDIVCVVHSTQTSKGYGTGLTIRLAGADSGRLIYEASFVVPPPPLSKVSSTESMSPMPA